jgi:hypothetical protein
MATRRFAKKRREADQGRLTDCFAFFATPERCLVYRLARELTETFLRRSAPELQVEINGRILYIKCERSARDVVNLQASCLLLVTWLAPSFAPSRPIYDVIPVLVFAAHTTSDTRPKPRESWGLSGCPLSKHLRRNASATRSDRDGLSAHAEAGAIRSRTGASPHKSGVSCYLTVAPK